MNVNELQETTNNFFMLVNLYLDKIKDCTLLCQVDEHKFDPLQHYLFVSLRLMISVTLGRDSAEIETDKFSVRFFLNEKGDLFVDEIKLDIENPESPRVFVAHVLGKGAKTRKDDFIGAFITQQMLDKDWV